MCKYPFKILKSLLYKNKKKCWENFCEDCDDKRKNSFLGKKCSNCSKFYKSSEYVYKMKRNNFPDKCQKCTQEFRNQLRKDFYLKEDNFILDLNEEDFKNLKD